MYFGTMSAIGKNDIFNDLSLSVYMNANKSVSRLLSLQITDSLLIPFEKKY